MGFRVQVRRINIAQRHNFFLYFLFTFVSDIYITYSKYNKIHNIKIMRKIISICIMIIHKKRILQGKGDQRENT